MINKNYNNLEESYLFSKIKDKVNNHISKTNRRVIKLGIGDVTLPISKTITDEINKASSEMSNIDTFHGYPDYEGYDFLRKSIAKYYQDRNINILENEILINDGSKCDCSNILDIFESNITVLISDPVYPVYVDSNVMRGNKIVYLNANKENNFLPMPDYTVKTDLIYLCSPNNPTGSVYTKDMLKEWIDYANFNKAIILFDAAYEMYITDKSLPRSIYEIDGARKCAIEFASFSKSAGFTGLRCGYTIIPKDLKRDDVNIYDLWYRRLSTKFNGVSYVIQRGANKVFDEICRKEINKNIDYYMENAKIITSTLDDLNIYYTGGSNAPYIWFKCKDNMKSWKFFDYLLENADIVGTPGVGFGKNGEGYFRLSAFGKREDIKEAMERCKKLM